MFLDFLSWPPCCLVPINIMSRKAWARVNLLWSAPPVSSFRIRPPWRQYAHVTLATRESLAAEIWIIKGVLWRFIRARISVLSGRIGRRPQRARLRAFYETSMEGASGQQHPYKILIARRCLLMKANCNNDPDPKASEYQSELFVGRVFT